MFPTVNVNINYENDARSVYIRWAHMRILFREREKKIYRETFSKIFQREATDDDLTFFGKMDEEYFLIPGEKEVYKYMLTFRPRGNYRLGQITITRNLHIKPKKVGKIFLWDARDEVSFLSFDPLPEGIS